MNEEIDPFQQHEYLNAVTHSKLAHEHISLYGCLYRAIISSYKFIAVIDTDEMIIPIKDRNWVDLVSKIEEHDPLIDSYLIKRIYFLDEYTKLDDTMIQNIPPYLHMMRHIHTDGKRMGMRKGFIRLDRAVSISIQF